MKLFKLKQNDTEIFVYTDFSCKVESYPIVDLASEYNLSDKNEVKALAKNLEALGFFVLKPEAVDIPFKMKP